MGVLANKNNVALWYGEKNKTQTGIFG